VERDERFPVHHFRAATGREEYASRQLESIAQRLTGGSIAPLVTHLIEQRRIPRQDIERLRAILDEDLDRTDRSS
jgi:predicted transcriptional regulator